MESAVAVSTAPFSVALDQLAVIGGFSNHVSMLLTGRPTDRQSELASMVHAKACAHARSIGAISHASMFDHSAIVGIARMIIECLTMYAYLSERTTESGWQLRYLVIRLHDTTSRIKLLRAWRDKSDYIDLTEGRANLISQIKRNAEYATLSDEQQNRLTRGEEMFVGGMRRAATQAGWDADRFLALYNYFSAHLHGAPMSFIRMRVHRVDYFNPSEAQQQTAAFAIEVATACLRRITLRHLRDFDWQSDSLLRVTLEQIRRDDADCAVFCPTMDTP
jgi:hypothetical protein